MVRHRNVDMALLSRTHTIQIYKTEQKEIKIKLFECSSQYLVNHSKIKNRG